MRQSDGSEILGPNDPRNLVIGIIHVSSSDDRQSIVNAITSQDKKGRDQIVLVLPAQNKSFKSAVDFEGLHQMAGELEATLVLVAPEKSKIANLAHKESFTVYPTLEELASAEFPPLEQDDAPMGTAAPVEDDEMDHTMMFPLEIPNATPSSPAPAVPPAPVTPAAVTSAPPETPKPAAAPVAQNNQDEDEEPTNPSLAVAPGGRSASSAAPPDAQEEDEESTNPLLVAVPGAPPAAADSQAALPSTPSSNLPVVVPPNAGALVPSNPQLPVYYEPIDVPQRRSWRGWIITGVTILVLITLGVLFYRPILDLFFPPTATVTIVPGSQQLQRTYQITAVLGVPDPTKNQVDARALYADSQTQTQTVKATGQGHIAGQQASGELTFYNTSATAQTVSAGTIVFDPSGLAVVNDQTVTLPAIDTTTGLQGTTVLAHTVNTGSAQNIAAYDFNSQPCCNGAIYVTNAQPFTGGEDQQNFTYVQQSDIDGVVQGMSATQAQQTTMALQAQMRANEKPAGTPRCAPQVKSDHQAGEQASSVMVSVTTSCVGEVYDMQAVQVLAARKLTQDAATNPGPAYAPVGNILAQVAQATPDAHGNVLLVTNAAGIWAYQFSAAQRAHFASLIASKSAQNARSVLLGQPGVQNVTITLTGVGVTTMPGDLNRITINVEAIQGLHL
jgi:hypothetical protein